MNLVSVLFSDKELSPKAIRIYERVKNSWHFIYCEEEGVYYRLTRRFNKENGLNKLIHTEKIDLMGTIENINSYFEDLVDRGYLYSVEYSLSQIPSTEVEIIDAGDHTPFLKYFMYDAEEIYDNLEEAQQSIKEKVPNLKRSEFDGDVLLDVLRLSVEADSGDDTDMYMYAEQSYYIPSPNNN